jgi:hypothetical protein
LNPWDIKTKSTYRQIEQQKALQEKYWQEQEKVRQEQEKIRREKAIDARNSFAKKNDVKEWLNIKKFLVNPFIYERKTIAIILHFERMMTATDGLFNSSHGNTGFFMVSGMPNGLLTSSQTVIVAGQFLGNTDLVSPTLGTISVPQLKFVDILLCQDLPVCIYNP